MTELSEGIKNVDIGEDARALAVQIISTLVYVKGTAADRLLKCAGVPNHLLRMFLSERNPITGKKALKAGGWRDYYWRAKKHRRRIHYHKKHHQHSG